MLTGEQRKQAYQTKYPGKTLARKPKKEQEAIKRHNKRAFALFAAEQKKIRRDKIKQAESDHEARLHDSMKFLNNKIVVNGEEAEKLVDKIVDDWK